MSYQRNNTILQVENLCVSYDRPILRDVNFAIKDLVRPGVTQGQVVSIVGRSGIGKSQLFRCLAGLQKPTSGRVLMGIADLEPVQAGWVGVVPQNYVLLRHRSVRQNLALAITMSEAGRGGKCTAACIDGHFSEMLEAFDIRKVLKHYPHQLSGGQRQRVSILQQILAGNRTILLDEPFSGLDAVMIEKVLDLLRRVSLMHEMQTLIIVSHDIESALAISDTALVLAPAPAIPDPQQPDRLYFRDGATITHTIDLAARGLAFQENIRDNPAFRETVREVRNSI